MFDEILQAVKEHMSSNPETAAAIPPEQADAVHNEIASHVADGLKDQAAQQGGGSNLLSMLTGSLGAGNIVTSAIAGGLVGKLGEKFGFNPAITGVIAAAIPTIIQKFASRASDPNSAAHANVVQGFSPTA
jgi:hypothetical protein